MTIEYIDLKPVTTEVTLGDYGNFTVRKFGAGEELELARIAREVGEMSEDLDKLNEYKDIDSEKDPKKATEAAEKISESMKRIQDLQARQMALMRAVISSDKPDNVDRLFNENSLAALFEAIGRVARG